MEDEYDDYNDYGEYGEYDGYGDYEYSEEEKDAMADALAETYSRYGGDFLDEDKFESENSLYYYFRRLFFKRDLKKLNFNTRVAVFDDKKISDEKSKYWGGYNWKNIHDNLAYVEAKNFVHFIYSLFAITLIDLNMHFNYSDKYLDFREKTYWPDFGNWGFGGNHEKVWKILLEPVREGFVSLDDLKAGVDEFFEFFKKFADDLLNEKINLHIDMKEFMAKIAEDKTMNRLEKYEEVQERRYSAEMIEFVNVVTARFREMGKRDKAK